MAITRRQFLRRTGLAAAGSFLGAGLFRNPLLRQALADTFTPLGRYFVVVFLDGGNDGLNTVTPVDNGTTGGLRAAYETLRTADSNGGLQLSASDLAPTAIGNDPNTGTPLALHPGLIGLKSLFDLGKVAVIQGCGYPDYSLSHEQARTIWQTANPLGTFGFDYGWMGRYLAANYTGTDIPGVSVRDEIAGEFLQSTTGVLAIQRLRSFGFPYDDIDGGADTAAKRTAFAALCAQASAAAHPTLRYVGDNATATLTASESYPQLHDAYVNNRGGSWNQDYATLDTSVARDIREVAKIIYGVENNLPADNPVKARFFELRNGGYDTHSNQGGASGWHYELHREVGDAINLFYHDCADLGIADKVCILIWSEFSRRVQQNANGTDHGSQGPMCVIGGAVTGGVYGNHPDLNTIDPDDGNTLYSQAGGPTQPFRSTDFRDVYGTLLKHWLGMSDPLLVLPVDSGDPTRYWTAPNFDLGFLTT